MKSSPAHVVELCHELFRLLNPWASSENHDNVAELTLKWPASRVLQRARCIPIDLEQVKTWRWHRGHVSRRCLLVPRQCSLTACKIIQELRPGGFRFADEFHIAQTVEELFLHTYKWSTNSREQVHF